MSKLSLNSISCEEGVFPIDAKESKIVAYYNPTNNRFSWVINIEADDSNLPDHVPSVSLDGPPMEFADFGLFSEIQHQTFLISFDHEKVYPILPDNPASFYTGLHKFPNSNEIEIDRVGDNLFRISWQFNAEMYPGDESPVRLIAEIPIRQVKVWTPDALDPKVADDAMTKRFSDLKIASQQTEENMVTFFVVHRPAG